MNQNANYNPYYTTPVYYGDIELLIDEYGIPIYIDEYDPYFEEAYYVESSIYPDDTKQSEPLVIIANTNYHKLDVYDASIVNIHNAKIINIYGDPIINYIDSDEDSDEDSTIFYYENIYDTIPNLDPYNPYSQR